MLEREDDLDGPPIQSSHAAAEAHELEQVGHPVCARLRVLLRDEHALSPAERVVHVLGQFVLATNEVRRRWVVCGSENWIL